MSKRSSSPAPLPPAKRLHRLEDNTGTDVRLLRATIAPFNISLYDELILCIFSHLSWVDLCAAQATSKNWSRLATDNGLWKNLFLSNFGRPRLRGARGFINRLDGREVRTLPSTAAAHEYKDWKWMFRISSNWSKGRCKIERLHAALPTETAQDYQTHLLLAGSLIISASSRPSPSPSVCLSGYPGINCSLQCHSSQSGVCHITALAQDQSISNVKHVRIAAFLSTGEFCIFHVDHLELTSSSLQMTYSPARRASGTSPVVQAAYHHPLLTTLSESFNLSIYDLSSGSVKHSQTLTSYMTYPPTSLIISAPTTATYRLVLTYSVPVYPRHWSVGVTELVISGPSHSANRLTSSSTSLTSFPQQFSPLNPGPMRVISTRTIRAFDVPQGWVDEDKLRDMQDQWSRKVIRVADTQTDGKWVILAPEDSPPRTDQPPRAPSAETPSPSQIYCSTSLQLYRLSLPPLSPSVSAARPKLTFVRNLHGHTTPVSSLAVADGRCVSLGVDGSTWVWDLETGACTEVAPLSSETAPTPPGSETQLVKGNVVFDERRIVTAHGENVMMRRFDV
ncbi:hypothetical protein AX17_004470 [Amanita inopinata Kibby_2008]|nr:hypothetical protein AX17_004470 [Amanita inopinata Kibby_2008]